MQASSELNANASRDSVSANVCTEAFYNHKVYGLEY